MNHEHCNVLFPEADKTIVKRQIEESLEQSAFSTRKARDWRAIARVAAVEGDTDLAGAARDAAKMWREQALRHKQNAKRLMARLRELR